MRRTIMGLFHLFFLNSFSNSVHYSKLNEFFPEFFDPRNTPKKLIKVQNLLAGKCKIGVWGGNGAGA